MKNVQYKKWFDSKPSIQKQSAPSPAIVAENPPTFQPGDIFLDVIGGETIPAPTTSADSQLYEHRVTIPFGVDKEGKPKSIRARCIASLTVDDWGSVKVDGETIVDMTKDNNSNQATGQGGHNKWTKTGSGELESGDHIIVVEQQNIDYNPSSGNISVCQYALKVVALEGGGKKCGECPGTCEGESDTDGSPSTPSSPSNSPSSHNDPTAFKTARTQADLLSSSSAGQSVVARVTESEMDWGFRMASFRGLGLIPTGRVQLQSDTLSSDLAQPAALFFNHPLTSFLRLPEEGFSPTCRLEIVQGARVIALRCYNDGTIAPIGVDTHGGGKASFVTEMIEDQEVVTAIRWRNGQGAAFLYSAQTGELLSYISEDGSSLDHVSDYLTIKRDSQDDSLRQIWNLWDGLLNIEQITAQEYTIALYLPSDVDSLNEQTGLYDLKAGATPFKSFTLAHDSVTNRLTITEITPGRQNYVCTWSCIDQAWSIARGMGADQVEQSQVRTQLEPDVWQLVTTVSQGSHVASCVCEIYQSAEVGNLLLTRVEAYGSDIEQTTTYRYDASGNLIESIESNGAIYSNYYDSFGRISRTEEPWGAIGIRAKQYFYDHSSDTNFDDEPSAITVHQYTTENSRKTVSENKYTYKTANHIKRVEDRMTALGASGSRLRIEETWLGTADNIHARGRLRMTQEHNGVQTWYDYAATSLHGASYTVTQETRVAGLSVPGQSTREVRFISSEGHTMREESFVQNTNGDWVLIDGATYTYDAQNRWITRTRDNGRMTSRAVMCTGATLWEIDEDGVRTDYSYDSKRRLIETTRSETPTTPETIKEYHHDAMGRTVQTVTRIGAMETSESTTYDLAGRLLTHTNAVGHVTTYAYSADGLTETQTSPMGATLIQTSNKDGSIAHLSGTGQREEFHAYDFANYGVRQTVRLADQSTVLSQLITNGYGDTVTETMPTTIANAYGYHRYEYNNLGQMIKQRTQGGSQYRADRVFAYDSMGNQIKTTLLLDSSLPNDVTLNRIQESSVSFEQENEEVYQVNRTTRYNAEGTAITSVSKSLVSRLSPLTESKSIVIDEKGFTSTQLSVYDLDLPMKRTTTSAVPYSDTLATQVMVDGFMLSSCDYQGVSASFTRQFTANGQTLTHTDGRGNTTTTLLDIAGRTLLTRDAAGHETSMTYCENSNNVATVTDAMGNVVRYGYDHRGRKVSEFGTGIAPACFAYDDVDQLISLRTFRVTAGDVTTDPSLREDGDTTTWDYHAATGLLLTTTHADGTQELRTYNAFNQLASLTNARGHVAQHSYQLSTGDLTQVSYNDESTPNQSFAYNHLGQITQLTDGAGTRQFTYDAYGEQEGDSVRVNSTDFKLVELRDEMGRPIGYNLMRGTSIMQSTSMSYDAQGRLAQAGFAHGGESKDFSYEYLAGTHFVQSLTHPNNIKWNYVYEAQRDLLTQINDTRGTTDVVLRTYTHDALGRPMTRRYARQGTVRNDTFAYNSRSELIGAQVAGDDFQYDYDNIGNRKTSQETLQGVAESLTYDTNELNQYARVGAGAVVAQEDFTPSFDADGNQTLVKTSTGLWAVNYNAQNRPVRFTQGETTIECQYDSQGRRVFKKVSVAGAITLHHRYLYRGYVQIATIDMTRSGLNGLWMIFWDPSQPTATRPLAIQIAGTWFTYGLDLTKNVCELYKNNGTIATAYTYTPFGQATAVGTTTQPLGWSSEFMDGELDLVYYNYRHYNPQDGRWINRDPIGIQGGYNLYGFVGNKVSWIWDELGLWNVQGDPVVTKNKQGKQHGGIIYLSGKESDKEKSGIIIEVSNGLKKGQFNHLYIAATRHEEEHVRQIETSAKNYIYKIPYFRSESTECKWSYFNRLGNNLSLKTFTTKKPPKERLLWGAKTAISFDTIGEIIQNEKQAHAIELNYLTNASKESSAQVQKPINNRITFLQAYDKNIFKGDPKVKVKYWSEYLAAYKKEYDKSPKLWEWLDSEAIHPQLQLLANT